MLKTTLLAILFFTFTPYFCIAKVSDENFKLEVGYRIPCSIIYIRGKMHNQLIAEGNGSYEYHLQQKIIISTLPLVEKPFVMTLGTEMNLGKLASFCDSSAFKSLNIGLDQITSLECKIWGDRILFFYSYQSGDSEIETLAYTVFEDGNFNHNRTKILTNSNGSNPFKAENDLNYGVYFSESNVFIASLADRKETDPYQLNVITMDEELSEIANNSYDIPIQNGEVSFSNPFATDNGDFYFTTTVWNWGKNRLFDKDDERYADCYKLSNNGKVESIDIAGEVNDVRNLIIFKDANEIVTCIGYAIQDDFPAIITAYFDSNGNTIKRTVITNDKLIFPYNYNRSSEYKKKIPVENHKLLHAINIANNGLILISENHSELNVGGSRIDGGNAQVGYLYSSISTIAYYSKEIFITKINANGEREWTSVIDKNQECYDSTRYQTSFAIYADSDKISFLFTDLSMNYQKDAHVMQYINANRAGIGVSVVAQVDLNNGSITQEAIFKNKSEYGSIIPKSCYADTENGYLYGFFSPRLRGDHCNPFRINM